MEKNKAYLYLVGTYFLWGTLHVAQRYLLTTGVTPLTVGFFRYAIALAALFLLTRHIPKPKIARKDWKYIIMIGLFGYFFNVICTLLANSLLSASMSALLGTMSPVVVSIVAVFVLKEPLTRVRTLCLLLAVGGAIVISGGAESVGQWIGVVFSISAAVFWGFATVFVRKVSVRYDSTVITMYAVACSLVLHTPSMIIGGIVDGGLHLTFGCILVLLYLGVCCTALALILWNRSLSLLEAATCSLFSPLQPVFASIFGVLLLHESLTLGFFIGGGMIVLNVFLNSFASSGKIPDAPLAFHRHRAGHR